MTRALELARYSRELDEIPVGAVVVIDGRIVGEGHNRCVTDHDPSAHAEIVAIRRAANTVKNYRLTGASLYVTLEPCSMCAGAILQARIARVVFGAHDERSGAAGSQLNLLQSPFMNHQCKLESGVLATESLTMIQGFFQDRRSPDSNSG
jgi:tRNA(adenine34) deaminase